MDEVVGTAVQRTYTYGLNRISENQLVGSTWTPSFYGYDGHGNVRFLTSLAGAVTDTYKYDAFGVLIGGSGSTANNFLYSGEQYDNTLNLYYLRARYYNPAVGRFQTRDPHEGKTCSPLNFNSYIYGNDDPVNRVDPSGRAAIEEYEFTTLRVTEEVSVKKLAHRECVKICQEGCDDVIVENPELDVNFLILCYLGCETACRSIYPF
jgi:RHS repeat-associated protein